MNTRVYHAIQVAVVLCAVVALASFGCEDKRRHPPSAAPAFATTKPVVPEAATPAEVVRALLAAVRDAQQARARGLGASEARQAYDRAMSTIGGLAARDAIHKRMKETKSPTLPVDLTPDAALTLISESWVSMAGYYVDGFDLDTISVAPAGDQPDACTVALRAARPEDRTRLEGLEKSPVLSEVMGDDGKPLAKDSGTYRQAIRAATLNGNPPFNVPIDAQFTIDLGRVGGAWRVSWMSIGPVPGLARPRPTARPVPPREGEAPAEPAQQELRPPGETPGATTGNPATR